MRTILLFAAAVGLISTSVYAREDAPLKWKLQRWEYIVLVQAGDDVGTSETRHVQNNIVTVLRGQKEDLPEFEWWRHKDHVKGQYYLMVYHKAPPGTSAWESFRVQKSEAGFTILTFQTDDKSVFWGTGAQYKDMALETFKELIKAIQFEPDVEKTEFHKHGMRSRNGNAAAGDKRLVEVIFADDDKPPTQMFHTIVTLWMSENDRGLDRDVYSWAHQGGSSPDSNTRKKATESLSLLKALEEPRTLPQSPNRIVTVRCADGDKWIAKRFPIDRVPAEVHQILMILGFDDKDFSRLTFIKSP